MAHSVVEKLSTIECFNKSRNNRIIIVPDYRNRDILTYLKGIAYIKFSIF